jgi:hypothetical protein
MGRGPGNPTHLRSGAAFAWKEKKEADAMHLGIQAWNSFLLNSPTSPQYT